MEELLRGTAKGQQRLEEAERRTRDTAGERAAKRIKLQFADRPADPASSGSASSSDFTAEGMLQVLAMSLQVCRSKCGLRPCDVGKGSWWAQNQSP